MVGDFVNIGKRAIVKTRCKLWTCPYCAQINKSNHYNRMATGIDKLIKQGRILQFVTLTMHENWRGKNGSTKNWRANKGKLLDRVRRKEKKVSSLSSEYVYIPEYHKDGSLHVHGIFTGDYGTRWWKDNSRQCGMGYMAQSEGLNSALQGINYCLKYISKQVGCEIPIKNFRRINYSSGFPDIAKGSSDGSWRMLGRDESINSAIVGGIVKGLEVRFDGTAFKSFDDLL